MDLPGEKVNKLGRVVIEAFPEISAEIENLIKKNEIEALVLKSGKPGNFIAGADIDMIRSTKTREEASELARVGQKLMSSWEDLPVPTIAFIDGAALGAGCEFALACTAIVMSNDPSARIGLPEVMLGVIPGAGGCVRLPKKIGLAGALDIILAGKSVKGEQAQKLGLVEACIPKENFEASAMKWVVQNLEKLKKGERLGREPKLGGMGGPAGNILDRTPIGRKVIFSKARKTVFDKTKGKYPAPLEALSVIEETYTGYEHGHKLKGAARDRALEREAKGFGTCAVSTVSKHLIGIFFLTESIKKSNGLTSDTASSVKLSDVKQSAVLGAGVMGGGIAQLFADKGQSIRMKDLDTKGLETGLKAATDLFLKSIKKRKISRREFEQRVNRIIPMLDYQGFEQVDFVIEAIVENMDVKKKVLAEVEGKLPSHAVIASNTSSLSITEMQKALKNPGRFGGMHFFNPVHKMPLVEVIRGDQTSDQTVASIFQLSKKLGKTPVVVKDAPGFLVNRLLAPYMNEAIYLFLEGVPVEEIDQALIDFGMPMGPMELLDEVGLDVGEKVIQILYKGFGDRVKPAPTENKLVNAKRLGKKTEAGIYRYEDKGRKKVLDEKVYEICGIKPRPGKLSSEKITDRVILPMLNEAARALDERIVSSPSDLDLAMIFGTGFAPFRGGPLRYADERGLKSIITGLAELSESVDKARFEPSKALEKYSQKGTFY